MPANDREIDEEYEQEDYTDAILPPPRDSKGGSKKEQPANEPKTGPKA